MLRAIENGIQLEFIELGNEVYAENLLTKHIYPNVDNYIDTCLKWSEAIWQEFPNVHIGVVGGDKNRRTREWNKKLSLALQNKFSQEKTETDTLYTSLLQVFQKNILNTILTQLRDIGS